MDNPEHITLYLKEKLKKINVNNPKANSGGVLLKLYKNIDEELPDLVMVAFHTIQLHFTTDNSSNPAGTAGLTMISSAIGLKVAKIIKRDPPGLPWNMLVRLGDLFVEAYYNCGYIDIYYPKIRDTSYIISATNKWIELADIPAMMERMRLTDTRRTKYVGAVIKQKDTEHKGDKPWINSINKLQATGWRINNRVYEALETNKDSFVSPEPISDNDAKEMKRRSKAVEWAFIMTKAKKILKDYPDYFYQAVEADYRGRIYYKEAFLNYQGSDLARGMLKFARAKPMTQDGLFWLAIHTASCYNQSYNIDEIPEWVTSDYKSYLEEEGLESISVDKFTLEDRVRWTNDNMEVIVEAGAKGIFAEDAEKKVSFLAACIEWYDYSDAVKNKRVYMSNLPIPIDGSNNGWQHLGAISKDPLTGELVGLTSVEIQRDFYVQTAKELFKQTIDDRLSSILKKMPMKHIRKGISKRGSMTRAYSAGATKIAENMFFDCKTEDYHIKYGLSQDDCTKLAKTLIKAINTVCPGPLDTMGYFQDLAKFEIGEYKRFTPDGLPGDVEYKKLVKEFKTLYIKKDKTDEDLEDLNSLVKRMSSYDSRLVYGNGSDRITWTTPSGFPVEYTNFNTSTKKCIGTISGYNTNNKKSQIKHVARVPTKAPDVRGFMCGISPNFIHSMDASHMALVIDEWNGYFGAVHDSFSTHACDVEALLAKTKEVFVRMYDVENFYDYIEDQIITNKDCLDVEQPNRGSLKIQEIYESDYFFA